MISKFSPRIEESIIFIKYLLGEEAQKILNQEGGYLPINKSIYENKPAEKLHRYQQLMESGIHRPFLENYTKISDIIAFYLNKAISEEMSAEEALIKAEQQIADEKIEIK